MAGMPYPPTSVRIRAHLWEALLCQKFLCVPCVLWESLSSHEFLLRRVWHLAIPTPPAMGYYSTEYAEFTEPPAEMSSHGFHGFAQILRVRCSPTEFTEFGSVGMAGMPYPPDLCASVPSVGGSSLPEALCIRCIPWELLHRLFGWCSGDSCTPWAGSVGMAGMPYPPTSVNIRAICGRFFSARGSVYSVYSVGASSQLVRLVQFLLWQAAKPSRDCCTPGGIHGSSVQISPPHHLTTSPSISPRTQPSACPPSTVGTTSSPPAAR